MKQFKPMLGKEAPEDKTEIRFPVLASYKLDGIRAIFHPELGLVSRSLKPIKNKQLQEKFAVLIEYSRTHKIILDGEFYHHDLTFQQITSLVMTEDFELIKKVEKYYMVENDFKQYYEKHMSNEHNTIKFNNPLEFHMFDCLNLYDSKTFTQRFIDYRSLNLNSIRIVNQIECTTSEELDDMFQRALDNNYEGLIIRNPDGLYKFGRSTVKEQGLLKYKPFVTYDAKIIGVTERFENTNVSFKNELGQSTKRNTVDAKKGTGIASSFVVEWKGANNIFDSILKVTLTGEEETRREIFENKDHYIGQMIEFKGMDVGAKDVPRHPVFVRFRNDR